MYGDYRYYDPKRETELLGSLSIKFSFFHPPLQLLSKKHDRVTLHFSCSPKNMTEANNDHSGLWQDICIARSSEKVYWMCFIMDTASYELAPSLTPRKDRFLFHDILWKNTSQDSALTPPEWQAGKAISYLCTGETAVGWMYLQDIIYALHLSFLLSPFMKLQIWVVKSGKFCHHRYCLCHFVRDFAEVPLCIW